MIHAEFTTLLREERARRIGADGKPMKWPEFCEVIGVPYHTVSRWMMPPGSSNGRTPKPLIIEAVTARLRDN